jgi:hypothetical protein
VNETITDVLGKCVWITIDCDSCIAHEDVLWRCALVQMIIQSWINYDVILTSRLPLNSTFWTRSVPLIVCGLAVEQLPEQTNKNKRATVEMTMMHKNFVCEVDWFQNSWGKAKKLGCSPTLLDYLSFARISWWSHWHNMYSEKMPERILQAKLSITSLWPPPPPLIRLR